VVRERQRPTCNITERWKMVAKTESGFEYPDEAEYASMVFEDAGELTVNPADVKELKFENVPKGTYLAEVDDHRLPARRYGRRRWLRRIVTSPSERRAACNKAACLMEKGGLV